MIKHSRKSLREAVKKVPPLMARPLREGCVKAVQIKEKNFFLKKKGPIAIKIEGGDKVRP